MNKMLLLNIFLFALFTGGLCSHLAKKQKRNPMIWFLMGFLAFLPSLIFLLTFPALHKKKTVYPSQPPPPKSDSWVKTWYYLDDSHQKQGPLEFPDLIKFWEKKSINDSSFIWGEGMEKWSRLSELPELKKEIQETSKHTLTNSP